MMLNLIKNIKTSYKKVDADYYVSSINGNDMNNGTSYRNAFKTFAPIESMSSIQKRGKVFAFEKGGSYEGTLNFSNINNKLYPKIIIDSYGKGSNPLFTCKKSLSGWVNESGNLWYIYDENFPNEIKNVWGNNELLTLGRYPKTGYNIVTSTDVNTLSDSKLDFIDGYWAGCMLGYMYYPWAQNMVRISSYTNTGGVFIWEDQLNYASQVGYGYFITHHKNCLTVQNEWGYDSANKKLYIYSESEPVNIYCSYYENSLCFSNVDNFEIKNINFEASSDIQIKLIDCYNFVIEKCNFERAGSDCINTFQCHDFILDSCNSNNAQNHFYRNSWFSEYYYPFTSTGLDLAYNIVIKNNIIENTGLEETKVGPTFVSSASAICAWKLRDAQIYNNVVKNTGYIPIKWTCSGNVDIYNNYVDNYCLIHTDGGGIYTWGNNESINSQYKVSKHGGKVYENIVINALNGDFTQKIGAAYNTSVGIYIDDNTHDVEVYNNYTSGAWINNKNGTSVRRLNIHNNTFVISGNGADSCVNFVNDPEYNIVNDNLFVLLNSTSQKLNAFTTNKPFENGQIKNNKYYFPFSSLSPNLNFFRWDVNVLTFDLFSSIDFSAVNTIYLGDNVITPSQFENTEKPYTNFVYILVNPSLENIIITATDLPHNDYIDLDGNEFGTSRNLGAYKHLIIVRKEV